MYTNAGMAVAARWARDLAVGLLLLGSASLAHAGKPKSVAEHISSLYAERPVAMMSWRQAKRSLVSSPIPAPLPQSEDGNWFVCIADIYLDVESGQILAVDIRDAPNPTIARAVRAAIFKWKFEKGEASTAGAVLSIPVAFYPTLMPDGKRWLRVAD